MSQEHFLQAYERMILREGGYTLSDHPADKGGQTYAGIARKKNPFWDGWRYVDAGQTPPADLVRDFYRKVFWLPIAGDAISDGRIAESLFDFAVNAGTATSVKLAQIVLGVTPDGAMGPKTLAALNSMSFETFAPRFTLAKIARYAQICNKDKSQKVFLLGWLNRALELRG